MVKGSKVVNFGITPARAKTLIREIAKDSSKVIFTKHARKRMFQRKITEPQVIKCLTHGLIIEGPAPDVKGNWSMKLEVISAGDIINAVVALDKNDSGDIAVVITAFGV